MSKVNKDIALQLRNNGHTYQYIADVFGVTRQAVFELVGHTANPIVRDKTTKDKLRYHKDYIRQHILKIDGGKYIRVNKRPRPNDVCELCGERAKKLDYHHWNDNEPDIGMWVCLKCHRFASRMEKGFHKRYLQLKVAIQQGM